MSRLRLPDPEQHAHRAGSEQQDRKSDAAAEKLLAGAFGQAWMTCLRSVTAARRQPAREPRRGKP